MKNRTKVVLSTTGIFLLVIATIGVAYAFFNYSKEGATSNIVTVGNLKFLYTEVSGVGNGIQITNALPMSDTEGKSQSGEGKVFDFKVEAKTPKSASIPYEVTAMKTENSTLASEIVKLYLTEADGTETETPITKTGVIYHNLSDTTISGAKGKTIYEGEVPKNTTDYIKNFKLRMWIDESADFSTGNYNDKTFTVKINVYADAFDETGGTNYVDRSGAAEPELTKNMIPVTYNETTGNWEKADIQKAWYDYDNKQWANAIVVKEAGVKTRRQYQKAKPGTAIELDDILQMLVWVPRYKYTLGTASTPMNIVFENKNTTKSSGTATGDSYLTHPAFRFGDTELNGFWIGKFESASNISCTPLMGSVGTACDSTAIQPLMKPNQISWTGARVSTFATAFQNAHASNNIYGYTTTGIDTHMIKNNEWGAVSYLTQSKYGRCSGDVCEKVSSNPLDIGDGRTITGCSSELANPTKITGALCPETNQYQTALGVKASTTGNIYGIYDMSGGSWEYMMATYSQYSGYSSSYNSGYNGKNGDNSMTSGIAFPESKYYETYTTTTSSTACSGAVCYGEALSETAGWNGTVATFLTISNPWLVRGGDTASLDRAGIFAFKGSYGCATENITSRFVLTKE